MKIPILVPNWGLSGFRDVIQTWPQLMFPW